MTGIVALQKCDGKLVISGVGQHKRKRTRTEKSCAHARFFRACALLDFFGKDRARMLAIPGGQEVHEERKRVCSLRINRERSIALDVFPGKGSLDVVEEQRVIAASFFLPMAEAICDMRFAEYAK